MRYKNRSKYALTHWGEYLPLAFCIFLLPPLVILKNRKDDGKGEEDEGAEKEGNML